MRCRHLGQGGLLTTMDAQTPAAASLGLSPKPTHVRAGLGALGAQQPPAASSIPARGHVCDSCGTQCPGSRLGSSRRCGAALNSLGKLWLAGELGGLPGAVRGISRARDGSKGTWARGAEPTRSSGFLLQAGACF